MKKPESPVLMNTGRLMRMYVKRILAVLQQAGHDCSMEQAGLLKLIYHFEFQTLQEISDFTSKDKSGIMRQLNSLEKKKLVIRLPDTEDKRKKKLLLTKQAYDLIGLIGEEERRIERAVGGRVSAEEMQTYFSVLDRIQEVIKID